MRISTNEFLLGSLNDMLAQQTNVNQLNREIATGQTMLDAGSNPAGASQVIGLASQIGQLTYDSSNAEAATQTLQNGVSTLSDVTTLLTQLRQTVVQAANGTTTSEDRQSLVGVAQNTLQQLVQLANTQSADGRYLFGGAASTAAPFTIQPNGQVVFAGTAGGNVVEIAPSLSVASTISGQNIFMNLAAGNSGVAVTAGSGNTGSAYALVNGVTSVGQVGAESLAGTQFDVTFSAAAGGALTYTVASGTGAPGSAGFAATSGVVASGSYAAGSDLQFGGVELSLTGTPAAGDSFAVQPGATASIFQTVQQLIAALQIPQGNAAQTTSAQQQLQNVLANLTGAQTEVLSAQASFGSSLSEIQAMQTQDGTMSTNAQVQVSNLQSANLPAVIANYSESLTALQAAQLAFARVQNLTLFAVIHP
jgi:flagellar hook-associated protein 3 FlgL